MTRYRSKPDTLAEWLTYLEQIHPKTIELGLERVHQVKSRLKLDPLFPIIVVGGTNGKGSVCAMLEAILTCAGFRVGCYTSPHFLRYNERVRIGRREVYDIDLCEAFEKVEAVRRNSGISLTYFEYGTLAAMLLFVRAKVDIAILEVGLGGRLDAVNVFDADCAIITSIGLDHMDYLGVTREEIGFEKAGIFRAGKTAICAETNVPVTINQQAEKIGANFLQIGEDFGYFTEQKQWHFWGSDRKRSCLPYPALHGAIQLNNASACLAALDVLEEYLPVSMNDIRDGLLEVLLPGRFQIFSSHPMVIMDVAHNPDAAHVLADNLDAMQSYRHTYAVFAMLKDKDMVGVVSALKHCVDVWLISTITVPRGAHANELLEILNEVGISEANKAIRLFSDPVGAFGYACEHATNDDRICVLGSFYTVSAILHNQSAKWQGQNQVL
jgi:dihydrofolate synthase / folylpolyglutamate synthase